MRHVRPSKAQISGGLVRTTNGKRTAAIEIDLYKCTSLQFNEKNVNRCPEPEYNLTFLKSSIEYLAQRLRQRGHLFLNEALDALGFDREPAGQVIGWHVEEGPIDIKVVERNDCLWITFNVHGVIVNRI